MRRFLMQFVSAASLAIAAASAAEPDVPAALEAWRGWVLHGQEFRACPLIAGARAVAADDFLCAWPGVLALDAGADGADVVQRWRVDADAWLPLPGDAEHWPQQVTLDGQPAVVVDRDGPALRVAAGSHELRAHIPWRERPQALRVPAALGLVALSVDGKPVAPVQRDGDELRLGRAGAAAPEADDLELRVFRRLADGVPATLTTIVEIAASGRAREETIGPVLPDGFVPLALDAAWPARLDADGRLRVRVQPGADTLTIEARAVAPLVAVSARLAPPPWPKQEIWSYAPAPYLRVTATSGALAVDPRQSDVPSQWSDLPAFALADGAKLTIEERARGLAADERNRLTLEREMWLDFDGGGWFARDHVRGRMQQGWRFDAAAPYVLERAQAVGIGHDDEPLLVTRGARAELTGVEWRTSAVDLAAGLRVARAAATLPVTGWQDGFDRVDAVLHLPHGYRLLGAPGADRADGSWISAWSLLDVFVAAVLAMLAWRLLGAPGGLAAVAYLVLGGREDGAPLWSLLAAIALALAARALPAGRLAAAALWLRRAALLVLVLAALPFVADQLRYALHPQLEDDGGFALANLGRSDLRRPPLPGSERVAEGTPVAPPPPAPAAPTLRQDARRDAGGEEPKTTTATGAPIRASDMIDHYSESTVVQTGAGEPDWSLGHRYELAWSGPVLPEQSVRLVIAPPWLVRPLRVVLVALLAWLVVRLLRPLLGAAVPPRAAAALLGALALAALVPGRVVHAQAFPPRDLLDEWRTQLTAPPKCAPDCAALAAAEISARGDEMQVALEAHAAERVALPLPFDERALSLRTLRVDGVAQDAIARHGAALWVPLTRGVHRVELAFAAAGDRVALAFPLRPMRVRFAGDGWDASGLADERLQTETLTLARSRADGAASAPGAAQRFAPFVRVRRTLMLGLEWTAVTHVERLAPKDGGFTFALPLLAGEHVTTPGVRVADAHAAIALADGETETIWNSTLDTATTLRLSAPPLVDHAEVWQVVVSPTWHATFAGVPGVAREADDDGRDYRTFEFDPLPGETLTITIARPSAAPGATRAIDAASLTAAVGRRATDSTLALRVRASQGGEQVVVLPAGAEVLGVRRDGEMLNLRPRDGRLSLPLMPGTQNFVVRFREAAPVAFDLRTPAVALGLPAANVALGIDLPQDRWLLATSGPTAGPAVLYWSELAVMLLVAFALSRLRRSPLRLRHWVLLGLGFSTFSWGALLVVVAWLFALDWRARAAPPVSANRFNAIQLGLAALTAAAVLSLFASIQHGLLGLPDMHVTGDGSGAHALRWFADRSADALPAAHAISLPLWAYRLAMLAWALWLAAALVGWLRRGFAAWTRGGYWRGASTPLVDVAATDAPPPPV
ncbi:MAG TPA: hypothetical protein VGC30_14975 [Dokdonella sp.]